MDLGESHKRNAETPSRIPDGLHITRDGRVEIYGVNANGSRAHSPMGREQKAKPRLRKVDSRAISAPQGVNLPPMRVLIADNDSSDRTTLIELCHSRRRFGDPIIVESGAEALAQIRANQPDVALLACELEDMTGFDVLRALDDDERPATIMVAPDDRYAAEALSSAATDYLTRPISADRLAFALERACPSTRRVIRDALAQEPPASAGTEARYPASMSLGHRDRLVGERAGRMYFFSPIDIDYIEADSNYVKIHVGSERYITRDSLTRLAAVLDTVGFVRISRAVLLNLQRVSFAERQGRGVLAFVLPSGARVVSSIGFRLEPGAQLRIARTRGTRRKNLTA
jgi:two-component system LytT family response regulator